MDITQVGKWGADDPLSCFSYMLKVFPVCCSSARVLNCTAISQNTLHTLHEQLLWQSVAFQGPQEKERLFDLLDQAGGVKAPGQVVFFFGFLCVEVQVSFLTSHRQCLDLHPAGSLIIVGYQTHCDCVVHKLDHGVGVLWKCSHW